MRTDRSCATCCLWFLRLRACWPSGDFPMFSYLAFGTALLALLLRGLARLVSRWTPIPEAWAVGPVVLALLVGVRRRALALRLPDRDAI